MALQRITVLIFSVCFSLSVSAQELTAEKKQVIDELLALTGTFDLGDMFSEAYSQSLTMSLKQARPDIDQQVLDAVNEEIDMVIDEELGDTSIFHELSYPIYHKYLSTGELQQLVEFYKTPIGKKSIEVMPNISQEAMLAGQEWGRSLGPVVRQRVLERLQQEGVDLESPN